MRFTVQLPTHHVEKFQEFCIEAYSTLMKEYRQWIRFIEENNTGGFQKINFLKVFGISAKEEPHSKFGILPVGKRLP